MPLLSVEHTYAALWAWGRVVRMQGSLREASRPTQVLPSLRDTRTAHTHRSSINRPVMYVRMRVCVGRLRIAECPPDAEESEGPRTTHYLRPAKESHGTFYTHFLYKIFLRNSHCTNGLVHCRRVARAALQERAVGMYSKLALY